MDTSDLPVPGVMAARIDLSSRLRVFDLDGSLVAASRELWEILEPDALLIAKAHWDQWLHCFPHEEKWVAHDEPKMMELGRAFLRNRFLHTADRDWIESIERSVAGAYRANVSTLALLSMTSASDRAALDVLMRRVDRSNSDLPAMIDTLMRLSALEGEITVELYNAYREYSAQRDRDQLTAEFRDGIVAMVETALDEGGTLRDQGVKASVMTRGMLGKASEVAAAAEQ